MRTYGHIKTWAAETCVIVANLANWAKTFKSIRNPLLRFKKSKYFFLWKSTQISVQGKFINMKKLVLDCKMRGLNF